MPGPRRDHGLLPAQDVVLRHPGAKHLRDVRKGRCTMNYGDTRLPERYWDKVVPEVNTDCWLWSGRPGTHGYGVVTKGHTEKLLAHRVSYSSLVADIPEGLSVLHKCDVRV